MIRTNQAAMWSIALLVIVCAAACDAEPGPITTGSSSGSGGSAGAGGDAGSGGMVASSSSSSSSSSSGGGASAGNSAVEIVNGGDRMKSENYSMVYTIGQPTQNQSKMTSSGYRMQGGLIGATESLP